MSKRVLLTGATGFAGSHTARRLLEEGFDVRVLVRTREKIGALGLSGAEVVLGDITNKDSVNKAMDGVKVVYHIAALFRQAGFPDKVYWDVNHTGALNLLEAALDARVDRFLHCSTVGVLGHIKNPPANETNPYHPGDIYQITKCEGEKAALSYWKEKGLPVTVVRPAGIYGPGDVRWLKLFKSIAKQRFVMLGSGKTFIHMVYVSDLVNAFRLAVDSPNAVGQIYIAGGERYVTLNEFTGTIAKVMGVSLPTCHIPVGPVRMASGICEDVCRKLGIEPPIYRRRVDFFVKDRAFDITKAKVELGYSPKVDLEEGVRRTASWYKEKGFI